jgi:hypothetical protein
MAEKAARDYREGKTKEMGFDELEIPPHGRFYFHFSPVSAPNSTYS